VNKFIYAPALAFLIFFHLSIAVKSYASETAPPKLGSLRYDEDYSYLKNSRADKDLLDQIKFIPLDSKGDSFISLGGEARLTYEYFENEDWGAQPDDNDGWLLQRYMLHADFHFSELFRVFVQLQTGIEAGRTGGPRPTDQDSIDLNQAFLDVNWNLSNSRRLTFRPGRQELSFGIKRLISNRDGTNLHRTFEGLRVNYSSKSWQVSSFVVRPVEIDKKDFDNDGIDDQNFWGIYSEHHLMSLKVPSNIDLYYLGINRKNARFDQGIAEETRHTFGTRLRGKMKPWDYDLELIIQTGSFGQGNVFAWGATGNIRYTKNFSDYKKLWFQIDWGMSSGDDNPNDSDLQTFNPLFPRTIFFGRATTFAPSNHRSLHPIVGYQFNKHLSIAFDWLFFWRQNTDDGIYLAPNRLFKTGQLSNSHFVGHQLGANVTWRINRHLSAQVYYNHFYAGPFLKETPPGEDIDYFATLLTYKF
jgi:hypothetical protein